MFDIGGVVPAGGTQANADGKPTRARDSSTAGVSEQKQSVSRCKCCGSCGSERSARRADGLRDGVLQDQLFSEGCRKIPAEMVRALQGANLTPLVICVRAKKAPDNAGAF
jgi:hypothetical protein